MKKGDLDEGYDLFTCDVAMCGHCGNQDCLWYDDFLDEDEVEDD